MKKSVLSLFIFILTLLLLAGCGGGETPANENNNEHANQAETAKSTDEAFLVMVTDATGEEIAIESKPERIISLMPSNTEIAYELGLGKEIVGVLESDNYPEEVLEKEKVGNMELNVEKIIALKPDLVLSHAARIESGAQAFEQLKNAGITVLTVNDAQNFDQVYESIAMIGKATGNMEKAEQLIKGMKEKIAEIQTKVADVPEQRTVFVEVEPAPEIFSTGKNTFMNEMLGIVNAKNIVDDKDGWVKMDQEAIIERNPDVIITTYGYFVEDAVDRIKNREGWQDISAIKNNRVMDVDSDSVTRTGPRLAEGVEYLAKAIYPEVFNQ